MRIGFLPRSDFFGKNVRLTDRVAMRFEELEEFEKDFKKLLKKYRSLNEDFQTLRKVLKVEPNEHPPFSFRIDGLGLDTCVIKVKKIACKSLKGKGANSGLRLIYAYFQQEPRIVFVEIFHKSSKKKEDKQRIFTYFK